jgi:uroporphyrinogen decarboxylase
VAEMTGRDRYLGALRGAPIDRVPLHEMHWNKAFVEATLGTPRSPWHNADDEVAMARATGVDMVWTPPLGFTGVATIQIHGPGLVDDFRDEFGTSWGTNAQSWPAAWSNGDIVNSRSDWQRIKMPDPTDPVRMEQPKRFVELAGGEFAVVGAVRGPFSAAWMLAGLMNMSIWIYDEPELLSEMLGEMGRWNTQLALGLVASGVDAICIHDDWGMNKSTFISPNDWRRLVLPVIAAEVETIVGAGVPVILHSDGNLNAILPDIIQLPLSGLNPLQRTAEMDLVETKRRYGDRICLVGNVDATKTLPYGTPDDVEREVLECLRDAAPGGRYILAPDHSYHAGVPAENTWRAVETVHRYGTYPLQTDAIEARIAELGAKTAAG